MTTAPLKPWRQAEQDLRVHGCSPVKLWANPAGQWWESTRGYRFFVQQVNAQGDVDAESFRRQMEELDLQRRSLS